MKRLQKIFIVSLALILAIGSFSITASAGSAEPTFKVTKIQNRIGIFLENEQALCLQRTVTRPVEGTLYKLVENPEISFDIEDLKKIAIVAETSGNEGEEHVVGYQSSGWTVTDNANTNQAKLFGGPTAKVLADAYVADAHNVDTSKYNVDVNFYESVTGEYQMLATFSVTEKEIPVEEPEEIPDEEPEEKPEETPIEEPEETPDEEPEEEPEETPIEEPEETPDEEPEEEPEEDPDFEVLGGEPTEYPEAPKTGDVTNVTLWFIVLIASAFAFIVLCKKHKKNKE